MQEDLYFWTPGIVCCNWVRFSLGDLLQSWWQPCEVFSICQTPLSSPGGQQACDSTDVQLKLAAFISNQGVKPHSWQRIRRRYTGVCVCACVCVCVCVRARACASRAGFITWDAPRERSLFAPLNIPNYYLQRVWGELQRYQYINQTNKPDKDSKWNVNTVAHMLNSFQWTHNNALCIAELHVTVNNIEYYIKMLSWRIYLAVNKTKTVHTYVFTSSVRYFFLTVTKFEFRQSCISVPCIKFHENSSSGSGAEPCGHTEGRDKANRHFLNYANAPKKIGYVFINDICLTVQYVGWRLLLLPTFWLSIRNYENQYMCCGTDFGEFTLQAET